MSNILSYKCSTKNTFIHLIFALGVIAPFEVSAIYHQKHQMVENNHSISTRIQHWHELLESAKHSTEKDKLKRVNNFFNQRIKYVKDIDLWEVKDYWATPIEILFKGAGDCEDYSIAKYFTLKQLGISEKKMRITYVKDLKHKKPHMVLTYSASPNGTRLILDNLSSAIKPASERPDLSPLYSFNEKGLWIEKFNSQSQRVGNSNSLTMWAKLSKRMSSHDHHQGLVFANINKTIPG